MYSSQQLDNERPKLTEYATDPADASYIAAPTASEIQTGVSPLDVLPAQWWNFYTNQMTKMNNTFLKYLKNCMDALSAVVTADGTSDATQLKKYLDDQFAAVNGDIQAILTSSTPTAVAATASVGTSTEAARADHVHNYTFSTTAPLRDNTTTAGVVGTSTLPARSDHRHPLVVDATVPAAVNATAAVGKATTYARRDHVHNYTFSTTAPAAVNATAAVGTSTLPARSDHVHNYTFSTTAPAALASAASVGTSTLPARSDHVHKSPVQILSSGDKLSEALGVNNSVTTITVSVDTDQYTVFPGGVLTKYAPSAQNSAVLRISGTTIVSGTTRKFISDGDSWGTVHKLMYGGGTLSCEFTPLNSLGTPAATNFLTVNGDTYKILLRGSGYAESHTPHDLVVRNLIPDVLNSSTTTFYVPRQADRARPSIVIDDGTRGLEHYVVYRRTANVTHGSLTVHLQFGDAVRYVPCVGTFSSSSYFGTAVISCHAVHVRSSDSAVDYIYGTNLEANTNIKIDVDSLISAGYSFGVVLRLFAAVTLAS